jgi:hypothetical protein
MLVFCDSADLKQLFVFGYAANIFNDDETAAAVDHGKFLVQCMADGDLLVDRYTSIPRRIRRLTRPDYAQYAKCRETSRFTARFSRNGICRNCVHHSNPLAQARRAARTDGFERDQGGEEKPAETAAGQEGAG